ncbi:LIM domain only protein 3-like isoform X2 [Anthonomus grandis grandis]|uniref:LIM domain only protein 3-like isoform X2 n=1 Tax=Anthonomus grandis grandis TaxID=2921223 RepID=UPI002164F082|nr:LIM domain only protein 3-like isoform X2 [Anthonomus grandis grandis]
MQFLILGAYLTKSKELQIRNNVTAESHTRSRIGPASVRPPRTTMHGAENGKESGVDCNTSATTCRTATSHHVVSTTTNHNKECASCGKKITERFLLKAIDLFWHEDCLKCGCCDCRLGEVGSTLYTKANLLLCKRDYLRLFGTTGYCSACNKVIPAFEMVMRAKNNVYHLECFACQQCNHRFCVGDRFYLCENKILCEYDYEERLVFANMAYNPSSLAHIRSGKNTEERLPQPTSVTKDEGSSGSIYIDK